MTPVWHPHRGPLLIHASKSRTYQSVRLKGVPPFDDLTRGAILGVVDVIDCVPLDKARHDPWAEGPWCWLLANPRPLYQAIPWRGSLSLFDVPDHLFTF